MMYNNLVGSIKYATGVKNLVHESHPIQVGGLENSSIISISKYATMVQWLQQQQQSYNIK